MHIAIVTPEFPPHTGGGILKYYAVLADALVAAGATVTVLVATPFSAYPDYETSSGVRVRFVPLADVERHTARLTHLAPAPLLRRWLGASLAAADAVAALRPVVDVVEAVDFGLGYAALLCRADRPPVLVRMHGSLGQISEHEPTAPGMQLDTALSRTSEAQTLPYAERLVALSPSNAAEWSARLGQDVDAMPPPLVLSAPARPAPTPYSGLVAARIQTWKGPELLCRALAALGARVPSDLTIAWAGRDTSTAPDGGSLSAWLGRAYPSIWGTRIVPIGPQPPSVIETLRASVRYVLAPSEWDTFNYTLVESMADGAVTIGSTGVGASYLCEPGINGFRFTVNDEAACGQALLDAHTLDTTARRAMGEAARATIARDLAPATVAAQTLDTYRALPAPRGTRPGPWLRDFFDPSVHPDVDPTAFLETVSIRALATHLRRRLARKFAR